MIIGIVIGLYLNYILPGNMLLYLGISGVFLGYFYTAPPFKLGYNGLGELSVFLGFGPLSVLAGYFVQAKSVACNKRPGSKAVGGLSGYFADIIF